MEEEPEVAAEELVGLEGEEVLEQLAQDHEQVLLLPPDLVLVDEPVDLEDVQLPEEVEPPVLKQDQ